MTDKPRNYNIRTGVAYFPRFDTIKKTRWQRIKYQFRKLFHRKCVVFDIETYPTDHYPKVTYHKDIRRDVLEDFYKDFDPNYWESVKQSMQNSSGKYEFELTRWDRFKRWISETFRT